MSYAILSDGTFINIEYCNDKLEFTAICEDGTKICYKPLKCQIVKNVTGN